MKKEKGTKKRFMDRVLFFVKKIPSGKTFTYAEVARRAGSPQACRAVGNILNKYGGMKYGIPCHRVVRLDGSIGGFNGGVKKKQALLKKEGVRF